MLLDTVFAPFIKERPICVMARGVLERLLDADRVDTLFEHTATQQYTRELLFSTVVQLMSEVVLGIQPSVHAAYQAHKEEIGVSTTALYNKLDRVETAVAAALVRDSARLAAPVVQALRASHPRWVPGYAIKVLDGNHLAATEHRLQELRGTWAAPLPGQALVVLDQQRMVITDVILNEDGHAQERRGIPEVLHRVSAGDLWIADRNFCTLGLMFGIARRGAAFLVRQHGQLQGELLGTPTRQGVTRSGTVYEQAMLVTDPVSGEVLPVRRMTLALKEPTRDGDTELHLLSTSTVSEPPFVYVQWSQEVMLFPVIEACKLVALQTPFPFMQHTWYRPALARMVQDQGNAVADLGQCHRRRPFFFPAAFLSLKTTSR
jgi:hypothetical protein